MSITREQIADVLAHAYDGQPLDDLRDEHAALHLEAADAVLAAQVDAKAAHQGPGRPASELPEWAISELSDRGIDDSEVSHFIASSDGRTIAAAVDGKPVHLTHP